MNGEWNAKIFTPKWISTNLIGPGEEEIAIEVPLDNPWLPARLVFEGIYLQVTSGRLQVSVGEANLSALTHIQETVIKILNYLPHTPISAVGINIAYSEDNPTVELLEFFVLSDGTTLADSAGTLASTQLKRSYKVEIGELNFNLFHTKEGKVIFDFNFHYPVQNAEEAVKCLEESIADKLEKAKNIMKESYQIELS